MFSKKSNPSKSIFATAIYLEINWNPFELKVYQMKYSSNIILSKLLRTSPCEFHFYTRQL